MEGNKVYIYGIMKGENIIYVGRSSSPKQRLAGHKIAYNDHSLKLKILDFFIDPESFWINKLMLEGYKLTNLDVSPEVENWEVGDIVQTQKKNSYKILNKLTNQVHTSLYELCKELKVDFTAKQLKLRISNPQKYPKFAKYKII